MPGSPPTERRQASPANGARARPLLALYPRAWRRRYECEVGDLLADTPLSPRLVADLLLGALDAHLWPQLGRRAAARSWPALLGVALLALALAAGVALRGETIARAGTTLADQLRPHAATAESTLSDRSDRPPATIQQAES